MDDVCGDFGVVRCFVVEVLMVELCYYLDGVVEVWVVGVVVGESDGMVVCLYVVVVVFSFFIEVGENLLSVVVEIFGVCE